MAHPANPTAFRLSRIHAQGWNAARTAWTVDESDPINPYPSEPERSRWRAGFVNAQNDVRKKVP